jgi:uncharacterized membrane protein
MIINIIVLHYFVILVHMALQNFHLAYFIEFNLFLYYIILLFIHMTNSYNSEYLHKHYIKNKNKEKKMKILHALNNNNNDNLYTLLSNIFMFYASNLAIYLFFLICVYIYVLSCFCHPIHTYKIYI